MSDYEIVGTIIGSTVLLSMLGCSFYLAFKEMKEAVRLRRKEERLIDLLYSILCDTYPDLVDLDSVPE